MSELQTTKITDRAGTGSPNFSQGLKISGTDSGLLAPTRTEGETQPDAETSNNGDTFYDTANDTYDILIEDAWVRVIGAGGGASISAPSWTFNTANLSLDSNLFEVTNQENSPYSVATSTDGSKMFLVGSSNDAVFQYSLSTAFDTTTATYDSVSFDLSSQATNPANIKFNPDGTKMFIVDITTNSIYQYSLSTAFDASTISYDNVSFSSASQETYLMALYFTFDGTKMYAGGRNSDRVHQYSLSTAFDLSTVSYDNVSLDISAKEASLTSVFFDTAGEKLFILGYTSDSLHQYNLSSAYDLTTATFSSTLSTPTGAIGASVSFDGTKVYVANTASPDSIKQYSTGL
jgi:hypothetical protein